MTAFWRQNIIPYLGLNHFLPMSETLVESITHVIPASSGIEWTELGTCTCPLSLLHVFYPIFFLVSFLNFILLLFYKVRQTWAVKHHFVLQWVFLKFISFFIYLDYPLEFGSSTKAYSKSPLLWLRVHRQNLGKHGMSFLWTLGSGPDLGSFEWVKFNDYVSYCAVGKEVR